MRGGIGPAVVVALAFAPAASAAPQFLPAATIEGPSTLVSVPATYPRAAMDAQGETAVVWGHYDSAAGTDVLSVTLRMPGGSFGPPQELDRGQTDDQMAIASNAAGDMAVVWASASGHVKASFRPAGGSFGPGVDLSQLASGHPAVRVDDKGDVVAVWVAQPQNSFGEEVDASTYVKAGGVWSAPHAVSGQGVPEQVPALAMDGAGHATVLWQQGSDMNGNLPYTVNEADGVAGQSFGAQHPLGESGSMDPAVAIGPSGETTAMWMYNNQIEVADRPAGGAFSAAKVISGSGADWPQVGIDGHGDALAVWERNNGVEGSVRPAGGAFPTQGTTLSAAGSFVSIPSLVMGADGTALAFWEKAVNSQYRRIEAAVRLPGGGFGPTVTVEGVPYSNSEFLESESGAADGAGDGAVVFRHVQGAQEQVDLAAFDGAGPRLDALAIPAIAVAGTPAAFAVSPVDVWSPIATVSWSFGDGGTANGAAPSHAYAAAGTDAVVVHATDALGNASSAGGTVAVSAAASPDTTAPVISGLSMSHRTFRVGKTATAVTARRRAPRGTTFRLRLSEAATVRFTFARRAAGRRSGRRCVKPAKRLRRARRCTRYLAAGSLTRHLAVGASAVPFSGRVGRRALRPGGYRATLRATDAAHNVSRARTISFRVVR